MVTLAGDDVAGGGDREQDVVCAHQHRVVSAALACLARAGVVPIICCLELGDK